MNDASRMHELHYGGRLLCEDEMSWTIWRGHLCGRTVLLFEHDRKYFKVDIVQV